MKRNNALIFYILTILNFYLLPIFVHDSVSAILILLVILPIINLVISLFYGLKIGFKFYYPIIISALFLPTIFIYYNFTAWSYILIFGIIALIGMAIGNLIRKKR